MSDIIETVELAEFREQWKAELSRRTTQVLTSPPNVSSSASAHPEEHSAVSAHVSKDLSSAVDMYRLAIQYEQKGNLDEALRLYRRAFRLDSSVDKAYHKDELRLSVVDSQAESSREHHHHHHQKALDGSMAELNKSPKTVSLMPNSSAVNGTLASLISTFPRNLEFEPEDERAGVPLRLLPDELLILILKTLDPSSIERFASINKKARVLALDSTIWRPLVQKTYVPPQVPEDLTSDYIARQYFSDYRRLYIEHPRLRLDGVYIAVCHYVRPGLSENAWVQVSHFITYHRYLRFFLDGTVISLLANEEVEPQTIIPLLKHSLRMKGFFVGTWSLVGNTIFIRNLADPSGLNSRYTFQMTLKIHSRPLGRWNKLDFAGYHSLDSESGEAVPLALKHERPFWFSKVRSYV